MVVIQYELILSEGTSTVHLPHCRTLTHFGTKISHISDKVFLPRGLIGVTDSAAIQASVGNLTFPRGAASQKDRQRRTLATPLLQGKTQIPKMCAVFAYVPVIPPIPFVTV